MLTIVDFITDESDNLTTALINSGDPNAFLDSFVGDAESLRLVPQLASKCDEQRATSLSSPAVRKTHHALVQAAKNGLVDATTSLNEIRERTCTIIDEHNDSTSQLEQFLSSFKVLNASKAKLTAVEKCRSVADAYARVLHPLNLHMHDGSLADIDSVAANIEKLIEIVNSVRGKSSKDIISDNAEANSLILSSIEKRAVDAVIKSRAAFVNVLDNEFRCFGWPIKVPIPGKDDQLIATVKTYVRQLNHLQRVSNDGDFIYDRTKSRRAVSDNWAVAAILRTPLTRFKYHFLEKFRAQTGDDAIEPASRTDNSGTSRFDKPEWAAEFALERIRETSPFLSEIHIDGPQTTEVKFAEGFCRVFAEKVAYDCELAMRSTNNDSEADLIIAHASDTAQEFDSALREGILSLRVKSPNAPPFQSSLHILSIDENFLTNWASSELRLAYSQVNRLLQQALGKTRDDSASNDEPPQSANSENELQRICTEIAAHIGASSRKCRSLESGERVSAFLKLTETPLLQSVRSRLKDDVEQQEFDGIQVTEIRRCGRAALCARMLADAIEDRSVDPFYLSQEERLGQGFYDEEITRLRTLYSSTCTILSESISTVFIEKVRAEYGHYTRFGEVMAPDAAIVLTHDLSESLVEPLTTLEKSLSALMEGVPCRRAAASIWRPVASRLDYFFFDDVILQCFVGGTRNAMPAASEQNGYLTADLCARMARQVAADVETFVSAFSVVSANPDQFLPHSSECVSILRIASNSLLLPSISARDDDEDLLEAVQNIAENTEDEGTLKRVEQLLEVRLNAVHICARDALELIAISGHRSAIRLV